MPTIREYAATVQPAGPGAVMNAPLSIADGAAASGRAVQKGLEMAVQATQAIGEQLDKSKVAKDLAEARADLTTELHNDVESGAAASPDFEQRVTERARKRLETAQKGYHTATGVNMSTQGAASLLSEFRVQANHYQSVAVGQHAALAFKQALDAHTSTLVKDPMQFDSIMAEFGTAIRDPNGAYAGKLSAQKLNELADQAARDLSIATVRGIIKTAGPDMAESILAGNTGPARGLSGQEVAQLKGEAETERRFVAEADNQRRIQRERNIREGEEAVGLNFVEKLAAPGGNQLTVAEIRDSNLSSEKKLFWLDRLQTKSERTDPAVVNQTIRDIHRPEGDPYKIVNDSQLLARLGRGITAHDITFLRSEMKQDPLGRDLYAAAETASKMLTRSLQGQAMPDVAQLADMNMRRELSVAMEQRFKDKKPVRDLITEGHPDQWLTPQRLESFRQGAQNTIYQRLVTEAVDNPAKAAELAARQESQKPNYGSLPKVETEADYNKLKSGEYFIDLKTRRLGIKP